MDEKISNFLAIAVLEHIVFILLLALAVYAKPSLGIDDQIIEVEIISPVIERRELEKVIDPTPIPPLPRKPLEPLVEELPSLRSTQSLDSYLTQQRSTASKDLPQLPRFRTNSSELGNVPLQERRHALVSDRVPNAAVIDAKPIGKVEGIQAVSSRTGLPEPEQTKFVSGGSRGNDRKIIGDVSSGGVNSSGKNRVSGELPFRLSGEVEGRGIRHRPKDIEIAGNLQGGLVRLSFKVTPNGTVFNIRVLENTAGHLKSKAIDYISRFVFEKLPSASGGKNQSGEMTINFSR